MKYRAVITRDTRRSFSSRHIPHILLLSCRDPRSGGPSGRLTTRGEGEGYETTLGLRIFAREFSSQAHSAHRSLTRLSRHRLTFSLVTLPQPSPPHVRSAERSPVGTVSDVEGKVGRVDVRQQNDRLEPFKDFHFPASNSPYLRPSHRLFPSYSRLPTVTSRRRRNETNRRTKDGGELSDGSETRGGRVTRNEKETER